MVNIYTVVRYVCWNCCRKEKCTQAGGVLYNSPEEQFRSKHQAMKDSCSRSKQFFFVLISQICIITKALTFAALQPEVPSMDHHYPGSTVLEVTRVQMFQQRILPLSLALGCTPASGRVQTWLFSNIIRKEIALLFFFANGLQPCVSCIPSRTHYAQQEKERKKNRMWAMDECIGQ